ncbi:MAG: AraC family transcriptional regulator [Bacteroidales bacterium]|nr:AraC family transcriptional regulator [Bacteroidales bacterium]
MSKDYINRINNTLEFINNNLDKELNLAIIAKIAFYSPFHFHRLFSAVTGEAPNQYVLRKRIERSAYQLKHSKEIPVIEIAINNGFESNAAFTKAFKKHYGIAPSQLRKETNAYSKIRQKDSKNGQNQLVISQDICDVKKYLDMGNYTQIEVKTMPAIKVAYVTHVGSFEGIGKAYGKLMSWAGAKGLIGGETVTCYHDNPEVTEIDKIRQSACIVLTKDVQPSGEVKTTTIQSGRHAVGKFEVTFNEFEKAWQTMMVWIAENDYIPNEKRAFYEIYRNNFKNHPQQKCIIEICVPVKSD